MKHDKNWMPEYTGPFRELIPAYVSYKRSQGYAMGGPILYRLREMDLHFKSMGIKKTKLTREMYESYTSIKGEERKTNASKRISAIRGFAKYLHYIIGMEDVYTGEDDARVFKSEFIPYIFSKDEIALMFSVMRKNGSRNTGRREDTFRMMMTLYYCCGMRKSEVQELNIRNVNFEAGILTVLHGKNDVSRMIPVSDSVKKELCAYRNRYLLKEGLETPLFCYEKGKRVSDGTLYYDFQRLLADAGIRPRADGRRQRLHDLRHTFCVRTLEMMERKGKDLYASLPLLSVYLGHKHITETEYYLGLLEEHFDGILTKAKKYTNGLFPEINAGQPDANFGNNTEKGGGSDEE